MKKRLLALLLTLTFIMSMFTGCGGSTENSDNKNNTESTEHSKETSEIEGDTETENTNQIVNLTPEEISNIINSYTEETAELYGYCPITSRSKTITDESGRIIWESMTDVNDAMYYYKDHILVIKGHGAAEHIWQEISGFNYKEDIEIVIIDEGITMVEGGSFKDCSNLKYVYLPSTLGIIGDKTFQNCENLNNVTFPDGLFRIGDNAFEDCESLTEVDLPDNTQIGWYAFQSCGNLKKVKLPQEVKVFTTSTKELLWNYSFRYCHNLNEVILPDNIEYINVTLFEGSLYIEKVILNGEEYTTQEINMYLYENGISQSKMTFEVNK